MDGRSSTLHTVSLWGLQHVWRGCQLWLLLGSAGFSDVDVCSHPALYRGWQSGRHFK